MTLPDGFVFGAATAAFQIEGAAWMDGRRDSIWDAFCRVPGAVVDGDDGSVACDHYHRYPEDVALMASLGLDAYRFSISWARVVPDDAAVNPAGLAFYDRLVDTLLEAGIRPWPTLYHWDLPQAREELGGWPARETAERFVEYALAVHGALGDRLGTWTTFNEPWCSSFLSYTAGAHAPGRRSAPDGVAAGHHLLLAHGMAAAALKSAGASEVGITLNLAPVRALRPDDAGDRDAARRIDGQFNRFFLDPLFRGHYADDLRADLAPYGIDDVVREGDLAAIRDSLDFLGVNYYHGETVSVLPPETRLRQDAPTSRETGSPFPASDGIHWHPTGAPVTAMGWEVEPHGLTELLERVSRDYTGPAGIPVYVTENGAAFDDVVAEDGSVPDADRVAFLQAHLDAVSEARWRGVDVRGYFYWSLLDNFEWAWGYEKRFGLVRVDYDTQQRTLKDSALAYRDAIAAARAGI
ncbi:GH1 family beta-glucosidase [Protaetiibacter intestinalis]|uniref:Beta-glucosidase n=1 Tax=Protaetiibacter intestinalis TaxID=2419774 RepID=A0A387B715_9MICO|nr:GH1 family beta-glucosidase [Protaetiibacter intestinalis]AYF96909.1 beta-glucosidase [Protaetiibacter intestinalis]